MGGDRNHRRKYDAGSHTSISEYTSKDKRIVIHGIFEGKECNDDIRAACKPEIQVREQKFLGNVVLCEYSRAKYCNDTKIYPGTGETGSNKGFIIRKRIRQPFQGQQVIIPPGLERSESRRHSGAGCNKALQAACHATPFRGGHDFKSTC